MRRHQAKEGGSQEHVPGTGFAGDALAGVEFEESSVRGVLREHQVYLRIPSKRAREEERFEDNDGYGHDRGKPLRSSRYDEVAAGIDSGLSGSPLHNAHRM